MSEIISMSTAQAAGVSHMPMQQSNPVVALRADDTARAGKGSEIQRVTLAEIGTMLNSRAKEPLHDQLFGLLGEALKRNQLADVSHGLLPSTRHMALALGVSRETVSKTIAKLSAHGFIAANERKRTQVIEQNFQHTSVNEEMSELTSATGEVSFDPLLSNASYAASRLNFSPTHEAELEKGSYENNYLIDKYRKTLRRQSTKRHKVGSNLCGLLTLRQVVASQLKVNSNMDVHADDIMMFADSKFCFDFVMRLVGRTFPTAIVENPGSMETRTILNLHAVQTLEVNIDEFGLSVSALEQSNIKSAQVIVSPTLQEPTGVSMSLTRKLDLLNWAQQRDSLIIDRGSTQGFSRSNESPSLWQISGGKEIICIWEFASILKPWSQICCAILPKRLVQEARNLRSAIGGDVAINEQIAMQEFILEGDLSKTQKHRELLCLEKRRRLNLAFCRLFGGDLTLMSNNKGPKMVFNVDGELPVQMIIDAAQRVDMPVTGLKLASRSDGNDVEDLLFENKLLIDLDLIALDSLSEKIQAFECVLDVYKSRIEKS